MSHGLGKSVSIRNLRKSYGAVLAVDDVTLEIEPGEFVALLGPSGSGKTTILMTLAGFESPDAGTIEVGGQDVTPLAPNKRNIGIVFQRYALFPHMTVGENIAFPLKMRGMRGEKAAAEVEAALAMTRLEGYGARRINQLSGGQQQRVALARALVYQPPLLLMDEPLGALDRNLREEMQLEIKRLQKKLGATVIYVTHDQSEALTMADRIAVMSNAEVQQFASPADIYHRPANVFVAGFVGETNFIDGTLTRSAGDWRVQLDGSPLSLPFDAEGQPAMLREGARVRMAVRPELMRQAPAGTGLLSGQVEECTYGGGTVACSLRIAPDRTVMARLQTAEGEIPAVGRTVEVTWPVDRARVFPL